MFLQISYMIYVITIFTAMVCSFWRMKFPQIMDPALVEKVGTINFNWTRIVLSLTVYDSRKLLNLSSPVRINLGPFLESYGSAMKDTGTCGTAAT